MAHKCTSFWGAPAKSLTKALTKRTFAEWKQWKALQQKQAVRPTDPFEGWVHRASRRIDYEALVRLYQEVLLAVKQPSDAPNKWGASLFATGLQPVPSKTLGDGARAVLKGLEKDGKDKVNGKPCHHEDGVARHGTPNWLEKPVANATLAELEAARDLLRALRDAFGR